MCVRAADRVTVEIRTLDERTCREGWVEKCSLCRGPLDYMPASASAWLGDELVAGDVCARCLAGGAPRLRRMLLEAAEREEVDAHDSWAQRHPDLSEVCLRYAAILRRAASLPIDLSCILQFPEVTVTDHS